MVIAEWYSAYLMPFPRPFQARVLARMVLSCPREEHVQ